MAVCSISSLDPLLLGWLAGRTALAHLRGASREFSDYVGVLNVNVYILHDVGTSTPLGIRQCLVDATWMFMNQQVTADRPDGTTRNALIYFCPLCGQLVTTYLFAGIRYSYYGQSMDGLTRYWSEMRWNSSDAFSDFSNELAF